MEWKEYEEEVHQESLRVFFDSEVTFNTHIMGLYTKRMRQVDVLVENYKGKTLVIDAKHYSNKVDVKTVESFISMLKDLGADLGILVSEKGFSKSAINRAHYGEENIEVDILNLDELKEFQSIGAIPYSGRYGIAANAPFGWIIDGEKNPIAPALLYQRGLSFEEARANNEWAYLQFYNKSSEQQAIQTVIEHQEKDKKARFPSGSIDYQSIDNILIRTFSTQEYPTKEFTLFRDFGDFIVYIVLFCPDNVMKRDKEKMKYLLDNAIPIEIAS
ncbi:MAG: restriction endonuclease [Muribaculaceae bacterium]|nr:restriction endonuclease [Muribaculaceae bacterium]